jgi:formate-dependent phosphoribosylglycinamide formyltransferase (GAR transformylase)
MAILLRIEVLLVSTEVIRQESLCARQQIPTVLCTNRPPTRTGDYQESWQPATILDNEPVRSKDTWLKKNETLGGAGLLVLNFSY